MSGNSSAAETKLRERRIKRTVWLVGLTLMLVFVSPFLLIPMSAALGPVGFIVLMPIAFVLAQAGNLVLFAIPFLLFAALINVVFRYYRAAPNTVEVLQNR